MDAPSICQSHLPVAPWLSPSLRRLPGMQPLDPADWLLVDDAYCAQMALRARLMAEAPERIAGVLPRGRAALDELIDTVLAALRAHPSFAADGAAIRRPDGRRVHVDPEAPLRTLNGLVQEDFCVMDKAPGEDEHRLVAGLLAFPSSWTLAEKLGRSLSRIHAPVAPYDAGMAHRVQRLFDGIRAGRPMWRANALIYDDPALFQPRREADPRDPARADAEPGPGRYLRSERQCLLRLPRTGAVVFSIHTWVVPIAALSPAQAEGLAVHPPHRSGVPA